MNEVLIMQGLPGSGKSSYLSRAIPSTLRKDHVICEADQYFYDALTNKYDFDASRIGKAHEYCFSNFVHYCDELSNDIWRAERESHRQLPDRTIVVANTNTSLWEITPYVAYAKHCKLPFRLVQLQCSVETALKRNTHNVPEATIQNMHKRLKNFSAPKDWTVVQVNTD